MGEDQGRIKPILLLWFHTVGQFLLLFFSILSYLVDKNFNLTVHTSLILVTWFE